MIGPMPRKLSLLALLLLSTLLLAASLAPAAAPPTANVPSAFEEELEAEVEIDEEEAFASEAECIAEEAGFEAIELSEAELREICADELEAAEEAAAASRCPLRSANGYAVARNGRLKVTVGYTASEPFNTRVDLRSGDAQLASSQRHLGRSGVLRFSERLGEKRVERVVVRIRLPQSNADCPAYRAVEAAVLFK